MLKFTLTYPYYINLKFYIINVKIKIWSFIYKLDIFIFVHEL